MSWGSDSPLTDMLNRPASPQELALLKRTFNINEFTIPQWQVIRAIIDQGTDVLAILPPASGKTDPPVSGDEQQQTRAHHFPAHCSH